MRVKNTLAQTLRLEQREAQQNRIPHTRPDRLSKKRHTHKCAERKTDQLPFGQIEQDFRFDFC